LWTGEADFSALSQKLHPKPRIAEGVIDV